MQLRTGRLRQTMTDDQIKAVIENKIKPGEEKKEQEKFVYCKNCNHKISSFTQLVPINGQSRHTFKNPAGIVFIIACFQSAEGCAVEGEPTPEYTWFPGFNWSFAHCGKCYRHLGWFYQSNGRSFFGLILNNLT